MKLMKKMKIEARPGKTLIIAGVAALLLIILVMAFMFQPKYATDAKTAAYVDQAIAKQQQVEQEIRSTYQAGKYTFTDPLVIQDPYQTAPLTALVIFDTPEDSQVSIHVPGKSSLSSVDFTFPGFEKHHELPVYGLYADMLNHVTVSMKTQTGKSAQTILDLQTEPLPTYLLTFTILKANPAKYNPGFNFSFMPDKQVFDLEGNIRWYSTDGSYVVFRQLKNGRYLFSYSADQSDSFKIVMERDLLGKIYAIYNIWDGVHHDVYELPNGNLLFASSNPQPDTNRDAMLEIDRNNGHIVRSIVLQDVLDRNRPIGLGTKKGDWVHLNSIFYDPADRTVIISSRAQSAVVKLTYPGMQIKWILGPHDNWSPKYQPYLLSPLGSNFAWAWSQHHATLYSPQVPGSNLLEILLFDNANDRSFESATVFQRSDWYSRVVHYRIDEKNMTIEQVWEYGQERGTELFSAIRGGAYHLSNGNVFGTWSNLYKGPDGNLRTQNFADGTVEARMIEIDPSTNEVVFEVSMKGDDNYRTLRAGLYDGYSEKNAYLSTAVNNTTVNDLADRSVLAWRDVKRTIITPGLDWLDQIGNWIDHKILSRINKILSMIKL